MVPVTAVGVIGTPLGIRVKKNLRGVGSHSSQELYSCITKPHICSYLFFFGPYGPRKKRLRVGMGPQAPNPITYRAPYSSVTDRTMMIASTNGTSLILRQKLSVPIGSPRCSFLNRTARKW